MLRVMKNMKNGKRKNDKVSIAFTIALFSLATWLETFIPKDPNVIHGTGVIVGIVGLVVGTGLQMYNMHQANEAKKENDNEKDRQQRLQDALTDKTFLIHMLI